MDRDTAVARMQQSLGFRPDLVTQCTNALQDAQDELERASSLPWFLLKEDQALVVTPPVTPVATPLEITLPTDFIKESDDQDGNLRFQQSTPGATLFIKKMDLKEAEEYFYGRRKSYWDGNQEIILTEQIATSPGAPIAYVLRKDVIRIYPGPDIEYDLLWSYYGHDDPLNASNIENRWLKNAPWYLISLAGVKLAGDLRDADAMAVFLGILNGDKSKGMSGARDNFLAECYERELGGRTYSMGRRL